MSRALRSRNLWLLAAVFIAMAVLFRNANPAPSKAIYCAEGAAPPATTVVMLSTSWCPYCARTRQFFARHAVVWCEYDIERSAVGAARHRQSGVVGVPVTFIDGNQIAGYDPDEFKRVLKQRERPPRATGVPTAASY